MNENEFAYISDVVKKHSGIVIARDKAYLLESHLLPLARTYACDNLSEFIRFIEANADEKLIHDIVDALINNESMFFRDIKPFEQIRHVILPPLLAHRPGRKIRIWSAACATGQEPYSVAMSLLEAAPGPSYEIIATDISPRVLAKCRKGIYTQFEIQRGMPHDLLHKYFDPLPDNAWQVKDTLRDMITFGRQNLLDDIVVPGKFDIVLCRNVLIYFDDETKRAILEKISLKMNADSVIILGSAETVAGITDKYRPLENEHGLFMLS